MSYKLIIDNDRISLDIWNILYILIVLLIFYMLFNRVLKMSVIKTGVITREQDQKIKVVN